MQGWRWCLLLCLVALLHLPPASPGLSKAAMDQTKKMVKNVCKKKSGVKQELLNNMKNGDLPEERKLMCYFGCCASMMSVIKNGKLNISGTKKQIDTLAPDELKEPLLKQWAACQDIEGKDECEMGFNLAKCCYKVAPDHFMFPA